MSSEIEALAKQDASCQRLVSVPGIGSIISSAVVAAIGNGAAFKQGPRFRRLAGAHTEAGVEPETARSWAGCPNVATNT